MLDSLEECRSDVLQPLQGSFIGDAEVLLFLCFLRYERRLNRRRLVPNEGFLDVVEGYFQQQLHQIRILYDLTKAKQNGRKEYVDRLLRVKPLWFREVVQRKMLSRILLKRHRRRAIHILGRGLLRIRRKNSYGTIGHQFANSNTKTLNLDRQPSFVIHLITLLRKPNVRCIRTRQKRSGGN